MYCLKPQQRSYLSNSLRIVAAHRELLILTGRIGERLAYNFARIFYNFYLSFVYDMMWRNCLFWINDMQINVGMLVSEVEDVKRSVLCLMRRIDLRAAFVHVSGPMLAMYIYVILCNTM